jgi:hypothetical protein
VLDVESLRELGRAYLAFDDLHDLRLLEAPLATPQPTSFTTNRKESYRGIRDKSGFASLKDDWLMLGVVFTAEHSGLAGILNPKPDGRLAALDAASGRASNPDSSYLFSRHRRLAPLAGWCRET